jgi:hypothetical protein
MAGGLTRSLKRWPDNYYLSLLLASSLKPLRFVSARAAFHMEERCAKTGSRFAYPTARTCRSEGSPGLELLLRSFVTDWMGMSRKPPEGMYEKEQDTE